MDRKVRDRIFDEIKSNGRLEKDYVVELIKIYDDKPDPERLIEQHYKSKADRVMSSFKDENGIRDCFAIKTPNNKTKYIDLSKPNLLTLTEVEIVRNKQKNAKIKKDEIIKKTNVSERVIVGQIKMEEYDNALKKELVSDVNI